MKACNGEETSDEATAAITRSMCPNIASLSFDKFCEDAMNSFIAPTIESACAGFFGTTGAVVDLAFVSNWLGDCVEELLDGDGEFHPGKIWVDNAESIGEWFYDLLHPDEMYGDYNSADMTDIQKMILAENMSAFSNNSQIADSINISDITADSSAIDQLLISSSIQ